MGDYGDKCDQAVVGQDVANESSSAFNKTHQKTTVHDQLDGLTPKQVATLSRLVAGDTVTNAAGQAGVDRTTVHRWIRRDHTFQAAYNAARRDLSQEVESRLPRLVEAALETIEKAVKQGDVRAALAILRGVGTLSGRSPSIGTEDPAELAEEKRIAARERERKREFRRLTNLDFLSG